MIPPLKGRKPVPSKKIFQAQASPLILFLGAEVRKHHGMSSYEVTGTAGALWAACAAAAG